MDQMRNAARFLTTAGLTFAAFLGYAAPISPNIAKAAAFYSIPAVESSAASDEKVTPASFVAASGDAAYTIDNDAAEAQNFLTLGDD
jgi:hypothetical protein